MLARYKFRIALFLAMLGFFGWREVRLRSYISQRDRIIEQVHVNELRRAEEDSLAQIETAEEKAELEGLVVIQKNEIAKLKDQVFEIRDAEQDTTPEGGIEVTFADSNECMKAEGFTITATEFEKQYAFVELSFYPIGIKRKYITVGGTVVEIIRPDNDCIEFKRTAFNIPPDLPEMLKLKQPRGSPAKPFLIGGAVGSILVFLLMH